MNTLAQLLQAYDALPRSEQNGVIFFRFEPQFEAEIQSILGRYISTAHTVSRNTICLDVDLLRPNILRLDEAIQAAIGPPAPVIAPSPLAPAKGASVEIIEETDCKRMKITLKGYAPQELTSIKSNILLLYQNLTGRDAALRAGETVSLMFYPSDPVTAQEFEQALGNEVRIIAASGNAPRPSGPS